MKNKSMKLYNTFSNKKEELNPKDNRVRIYACGPTVYNYFHIGNARCFVAFDMMRRYLKWRGYDVTFVQNFTDIDDKMIKRANEEGTDVKTVAEKYIGEYFVDAKGLGVEPADVHPRATENMDEIINIVSTLIEKGHAYESEGDVYFSVRSFKDYGKLSGTGVDELESGARIDVSEIKRDPLDFALWKKAKPGEPFWASPWSEGRPGWHIECSAMVKKYLGDTIDIHCGGQDLVFPHHENEVAQSEAAFGVPFCRFFVHNGYINVDNKKMSKSLGNFFTVRDAAEKYSYDAIRFFLLCAHYRSPINFSAEALEQSKAALERLYTCGAALREAKATGNKTLDFEGYRAKFCQVMDDDFNTADGIAVLFEMAREINKGISEGLDEESLNGAKKVFFELTELLGFKVPEAGEEFDAEIYALVEERVAAKKAKNFSRADEIRDILKEKGIVLEDTKEGTKIKKV